MNLARLAHENLERYGEYDSLFFQGRWYQNTEWSADAGRFANVLASFGTRPGDRVAVMLPNSLEVFQAYGGIMEAGAIAVPIVFLLAADEIRHIVEDCRPSVLVTAPLFLDKTGRRSTGSMSRRASRGRRGSAGRALVVGAHVGARSRVHVGGPRRPGPRDDHVRGRDDGASGRRSRTGLPGRYGQLCDRRFHPRDLREGRRSRPSALLGTYPEG